MYGALTRHCLPPLFTHVYGTSNHPFTHPSTHLDGGGFGWAPGPDDDEDPADDGPMENVPLGYEVGEERPLTDEEQRQEMVNHRANLLSEDKDIREDAEIVDFYNDVDTKERYKNDTSWGYQTSYVNVKAHSGEYAVAGTRGAGYIKNAPRIRYDGNCMNELGTSEADQFRRVATYQSKMFKKEGEADMFVKEIEEAYVKCRDDEDWTLEDLMEKNLM